MKRVCAEAVLIRQRCDVRCWSWYSLLWWSLCCNAYSCKPWLWKYFYSQRALLSSIRNSQSSTLWCCAVLAALSDYLSKFCESVLSHPKLIFTTCSLITISDFSCRINVSLTKIFCRPSSYCTPFCCFCLHVAQVFFLFCSEFACTGKWIEDTFEMLGFLMNSSVLDEMEILSFVTCTSWIVVWSCFFSVMHSVHEAFSSTLGDSTRSYVVYFEHSYLWCLKDLHLCFGQRHSRLCTH